MKKLYAGSLAIILCGMIFVGQAAVFEMKEMEILRDSNELRGDRDGLKGLLVGLARVNKRPENLRNLITQASSDTEMKEHADQLNQYLFVPGLVDGDGNVDHFKERVFEAYRRNFEMEACLIGFEGAQKYDHQALVSVKNSLNEDKVVYNNIIEALKNLKNGNDFRQLMQEKYQQQKTDFDNFIASSSNHCDKKKATEIFFQHCETHVQRALVISLYILSQSPKNLLEAIPYVENFKLNLLEGKVICCMSDKNKEIIISLLGAIIGVKEEVSDDELVRLTAKEDLNTEINQCLDGIELEERKNNSPLGRFINKKTGMVALAVICCFFYYFKLWPLNFNNIFS